MSLECEQFWFKIKSEKRFSHNVQGGYSLLVLAHRGTGAGANENSLNSFKEGLEGGTDGIEFDVRITKDNVVVCSHDDSLNRVFGIELKVSELDYEELVQLGLTKNGRLLKADEVFEEFGKDIYYNIEIKDPGAVSGLADLIKKYEITNYMISTFKHDCLPVAKGLLPELNTATLINFKNVVDYKEYMEEIISKYNPFAVNLDVRYFLEGTDEKVKYFSKLREGGLKISFWTVNTMDNFMIIKDICDYLITDNSQLFLEYR